MAVQKTFLKWVGSKVRMMPELLRHVPPSGSVLREAFAGSGALFMNTNYEVYHLNDANADLINSFRLIAEDCDAFIRDLKALFLDGNSASAYDERVKQYNTSTEGRERALLFNYLVRHSFNGLYRVNQGGGFNAPFGRYASVYFPEKEMTLFAEKVTRAREVHFSALDFQQFLNQGLQEKGGEGVLYLDPPYVPASTTSNFCSYTGGGFTGFHQQLLHHYAVMYAAGGHKVVLSNSDTPITRKLYAGHMVNPVDVRRSVASKGERRGKAQELIVCYQRPAAAAA